MTFLYNDLVSTEGIKEASEMAETEFEVASVVSFDPETKQWQGHFLQREIAAAFRPWVETSTTAAYSTKAEVLAVIELLEQS